MSRIKISLSLIMMLAFLSLGFFAVVNAEEIPKGPNGEELYPTGENTEKEVFPSDKDAGISSEPPIPTLENSTEQKDEPVEALESAVSESIVSEANSQTGSTVSGFWNRSPYIAIVVLLVASLLVLLVFILRKMRRRNN